MQLEQDTIVAISTPPGRGGIGIVRLSGPQAREIAASLCRLRHPLVAGKARFAELLDDAGEVLDEGLLTLFAAPHSYTSEDVVEVSAHGAPVLLDFLVRACVARGARLAEPGEFTQRAFLSGRLDLTQAEAVNDLIGAQTLHQARVAAAQLGGGLARRIAPVKQELTLLVAALEAGVDFAEDDLDLLSAEEIAGKVEGILVSLTRLAGSYRHGRIVRDGFSMAIVGRPNAGKSSLFNKLLKQERAIVTAEPGTTRDTISDWMSIEGIPVEMIDTAGLREAESEAESRGIERTRSTMAEADVVLHVVDATEVKECLGREDEATLLGLVGRPHLLVLNKCDLARPQVEGVLVSAATGEGIEELKQLILREIGGVQEAQGGALLTNLRQHGAVEKALQAIASAGQAAKGLLPHEVILLDLYACLEALDELTGTTTNDDILHLIFSSFCIGK